MEATPSSTLVVVETDLLFQILEVRFMRHLSFAVSTSAVIGVVSGRVRASTWSARSRPQATRSTITLRG
jgi:hypothetical protein